MLLSTAGSWSGQWRKRDSFEFKFNVRPGLKQEVFRVLVEGPTGLGELWGRRGLLLKAGKVPETGL